MSEFRGLRKHQKHPARTVDWVEQLCQSWLSPGRGTQISYGRSPNGTIQLLKKQQQKTTTTHADQLTLSCTVKSTIERTRAACINLAREWVISIKCRYISCCPLVYCYMLLASMRGMTRIKCRRTKFFSHCLLFIWRREWKSVLSRSFSDFSTWIFQFLSCN